MKYLITMIIVLTILFGQDKDYYAIKTYRDTIAFRNDSLIVKNYSKWGWESKAVLLNISFLGYDYYKGLREIGVIFDDDIAEQIERIFESETNYNNPINRGSIPDARWFEGIWYNTICLEKWIDCQSTVLHIHEGNQ